MPKGITKINMKNAYCLIYFNDLIYMDDLLNVAQLQ
jgi:hypothetical protein